MKKIRIRGIFERQVVSQGVTKQQALDILRTRPISDVIRSPIKLDNGAILRTPDAGQTFVISGTSDQIFDIIRELESADDAHRAYDRMRPELRAAFLRHRAGQRLN